MRVSTLAKLIGIIIFALLLSFCFKPGYALEESDSYDDLPLDEALLHNSDKEDVEDNDDFEADYLPEENERKNLDSDNDGTDPYILSYSSDETTPDNAPEPETPVKVESGKKVLIDEEPVLEDYVVQGSQLNCITASNDIEMPEEDIQLVESWSDYMPSGSAIAESYDGIVAFASWECGVFPYGTGLQIEEKSQGYANEIGKLALGNDIQIVDSIAVDISFISEESNTDCLQPYDDNIVHIELELQRPLKGDRFYLIHQKNDGSIEFMNSAVVSIERFRDGRMQASGVSFDSNSFSVYTLLGAAESGRFARRTYEFIVNETLFSTQTITKEDTLLDPGIPSLTEDQDFIGWYRADDPNQTLVTIEDLRYEFALSVVHEGETIRLIARILTTCTVTYQDESDTVMKTVKVYDGDDFLVSEKYEPDDTSKVFKGWLWEDALYPLGETIQTVSSNIVLTPKLVNTFLISFDKNCDDDSVPNIPPVVAEEGTAISSCLPDAGQMIRPGYNFDGWHRGKNEDGNIVLEDDEISGGVVSEAETYYAKWTPVNDSVFTVKIWKQSIEDDYRIGLTEESPYYDPAHDMSEEQKKYVFDRAFQLSGITGSDVLTAESIEDYINPDEGFVYQKTVIQNGIGSNNSGISAEGNTIANIYLDRQIWSLSFDDIQHTEYTLKETEEASSNIEFGKNDQGDYFPIYYLLRPVGNPTTREEPSVQYGIDENGNAFPIYLLKTTVFEVRTTNGGTQYGKDQHSNEYFQIFYVNDAWRYEDNADAQEYSGIRYYAHGTKKCWVKSNSGYGVEYGETKKRYLNAEYGWYNGYDLNADRYSGDHYILSTLTSKYGPFTGLYGQSFEKYGYTWPNEEVWDAVPYLYAFENLEIFNSIADDGIRYRSLSEANSNSESRKITVQYYRKNTENTFTIIGTSSFYLGANSDCKASNPYVGLTLFDFYWSNTADYPGDNAGWVGAIEADNNNYSCGDGDGKSFLHLRFVPNTYHLVFRDSENQEELKTISVTYGNNYSVYQNEAPFNLSKPDRVFNGWFLDRRCTERFDWNGIAVLSDKTLYAGWEKCNYRIEIDLCDDQDAQATFIGEKSFLVQAGRTVSLEFPERNGYRFLGFYTDDLYTNRFDDTTPVISALSGMDHDYSKSDEYLNGKTVDGALIHGPEDDSDYVAGKLTLFAKWEKIETVIVRIVYDANGGVNAPVDSADYFGMDYAAAHSICTPPEGMAFLCWIYSDSETGLETEVYPGHYFALQRAGMIESEENGNIIRTITLKAKYVEQQKPEDVTVIFDSNGGSGEYRLKVPANEEFAMPSQLDTGFIREGYVLIGWNTEIDGSGVAFEVGDCAAANTNGLNCLYAIWDREIIFTFRVNDLSLGEVSAEEICILEHSNQIITVTAAAKNHAIFIRWKANHETVSTEDTLTLTKPAGGWESAEYLAVFEKETSSVLFDLDSSDATIHAQTIQKVPYGERAIRPEDPERNGFRFGGWMLDGEEYDFAKPVLGDLTLTAKWLREYTVSYSVFSCENGTLLNAALPPDKGYLPGEKVLLPGEPEAPSGYDIFSGWRTNDAQIQNKDFFMPSHDVEICGTFTPIRYQISYNLNGGYTNQNNPDSYTVETETIVLSNPVKNGYVFSGWSDLNGTDTLTELVIENGSTGNRSYTAVWTPSSDTPYQLIVHYPDGWILTDTIEGAEINAEQRIITYLCRGTTDTEVNTVEYQITEDMRLVYDERNSANVSHGIIAADGTLKLHVYLKYADYSYTLEFCLKDTERVVATKIGKVQPDSDGKAIVPINLDDAVVEDSYTEYVPFMETDGTEEVIIEENNSAIRIPVILRVVIDRLENREEYENGSVQYGYSPGEIIGTGLTTVSPDGRTAVSGLLPGDLLLLDYDPASGEKAGTYLASYNDALFKNGEEILSCYSFSGFNPTVMGKLTILETVSVTWMNGDTVLWTDTFVHPGTVPEFKGDTPEKNGTAKYEYSFSGWEPEPAAVSHDTVYHAAFAKIIRKYTVTWLNYDGSAAFQKDFEYGSFPVYGGNPQEKPSDAEYSYAFRRWIPAYTEVDQETTYTPEFTRTPRTYHVTFLLDGQRTGSVLTKEFGELVSLRVDPVKDGFDFSGWSSEDVQILNRCFTMPAKDVMISGAFTEIMKQPFDKSTLKDNQRTVPNTDLVYNGEDQDLLIPAAELPTGYARNLYSINGGVTWTSAVPTGKNAGEYSVIVKYIGDIRHEDFTDDEITVRIGKAVITSFQATLREPQIYSGEKISLLASATGLPEGCSVEYCVRDGDGHLFTDWSGIQPEATKPGTYQVSYRIDGGVNYISIPETIIDNGSNKNAVIEKGEREAPKQKPIASITGSNSITVNPALSGQEYIVVPRAQMPSDIDWQTKAQIPGIENTIIFNDLTFAQTYVVYTRSVATDCYHASSAIAGDPLSIPKQPQAKPNADIQVSVTATSITVKPAFADQEYSLDHGIGWVSAENNKLIFDGLKPDTDYELITRKAETDTKAASEASEPMKIKTLTGTVLTEIRANDDMLPLISVSGLDEILSKTLLSAEENQSVLSGKTETVFLEISDVSSCVSETDKNLIYRTAKEKNSGAVVIMHLDISLYKQLEGESPVAITSIGSNSIEVTLTIPAKYLNTDSATTRSFYVVRVHGSTADVLTPTVTGNQLVFSTGLFSTYSLFYVDRTESVPETDEMGIGSGTAVGSSVASNGTSTPTAASVSVVGTASVLPESENNVSDTDRTGASANTRTAAVGNRNGVSGAEKQQDNQISTAVPGGKDKTSVDKAGIYSESDSADLNQRTIRRILISSIIIIILLCVIWYYIRSREEGTLENGDKNI